jgi:transcriptional regulator with XRE-family HTH domain
MGNNMSVMANRLAKRLTKLRAQQGLTQAALAERAGVTRSYIGRLEIGRHDPQLSTLYKLAKALRISIAELVK